MDTYTTREPRPHDGAVCPLINWQDLTPAERKDFDWASEDDGLSFFRYRDNCYCLSDFMVDTAGGIPGHWDSYSADSAWSGTAIRIMPDCEHVAAAYVY